MMNKPGYAMKIVTFCVGLMFVGGLTDMYFKEQRHRRLTREHKAWDDEKAGKEAAREALWMQKRRDLGLEDYYYAKQADDGSCPPYE